MKLCECIEKLTCLVTDHPELDDKDIVVLDENGTETVINEVDFFDEDSNARTGETSYFGISGKVVKIA